MAWRRVAPSARSVTGARRRGGCAGDVGCGAGRGRRDREAPAGEQRRALYGLVQPRAPRPAPRPPPSAPRAAPHAPRKIYYTHATTLKRLATRRLRELLARSHLPPRGFFPIKITPSTGLQLTVGIFEQGSRLRDTGDTYRSTKT